MPRTLDTDLQALIDTGHREDHTAVVLTLGDAGPTVLHFATGEQLVGSDLYLGKLKESDALKISLSAIGPSGNAQVDGCTLKIQNVDKVFGQQLTAASDSLDGATAMLGLIFVDRDTGATWFDPKMPGDIIAGAIDENEVPLNFVADIYASDVVGETIASVFPYQTPPVVSGIVVSDPNDLLPLGGGPLGGGGGGLGGGLRGGGRLPDLPGQGFLAM